MTPLCRLEWDDGVLRSFGEGLPTLEWTRPADLAAARLDLVPAPDRLHLEDGPGLLSAAFRTIPFLRGLSPLKSEPGVQKNGGLSPLKSEPGAQKNEGLSPLFSFGDGVTKAARTAFVEFAEGAYGVDEFRVLRGEPDDFVVFARRSGDIWKVGALCAAAGSLTVRFEDLWLATPESNRRPAYRVDVLHDAPEGNEILEDVAPDARIFLDHAAGGGFLLTFTPFSS